jgi:hypothetical protein
MQINTLIFIWVYVLPYVSSSMIVSAFLNPKDLKKLLIFPPEVTELHPVLRPWIATSQMWLVFKEYNQKMFLRSYTP